MPTNQIPTDGQFISLATAIEMTTKYRENDENILAPEFKGKDILAISETFNKDAIGAILSIPECKAIRIYYGMSDDLKVHAILVGVNDKNEDILQDTAVIVEDGRRCPPSCGPASVLNNPV